MCTQAHARCAAAVPQRFSSGARPGGGSTHGEPPLAILLMIFMTTQKPSDWGQSGDWTNFHAGPPLNYLFSFFFGGGGGGGGKLVCLGGNLSPPQTITST